MNEFAGTPWLVSLAVYDGDLVAAHGQGHFVRLVAETGADGVEIRHERFRDPTQELPEVAAAIREASLTCVLSAPVAVYDAGGAVQTKALRSLQEEAAALGAPAIKVNLGRFRPGISSCAWPAGEAAWWVENDQTVEGGGLSAFRTFFAEAPREVGMTFDLGNWVWVGADPHEAAKSLRDRTRYLHIKAVEARPTPHAVPPNNAHWETVQQLLGRFPSALPCALEFPIQGTDLQEETARWLQRFRAAGREVRSTKGEHFA